MAITSGGPLIHSISRAYGSVVIGNETPLVTPEDVPREPAYWRQGRQLDLATIVDELRYRGLSVKDTPEFSPLNWSIEADIEHAGRFVALVIVRVSAIKETPFVLEVLPTSGDIGASIVRSHSTTMQRLLHTVDVLLAGIRLGTEQHVA